MKNLVLACLLLSVGCGDNITNLVPLSEPGFPDAGDRCSASVRPLVENAGCDGRCRESFLTCNVGIWDCIGPAGTCTPLPPRDAAVASDAVIAPADVPVMETSVDVIPAMAIDAAVITDVAVSTEAAVMTTTDVVVIVDSAPPPDVFLVTDCSNDPNVEGAPCVNGAGACTTRGVWRCNPALARRTCTAPPPGTPSPEICDNIDNDCNGRVDDNVPRRQCYGAAPGTLNRGVCHAGWQTCTAGVLSACEGEVRPQAETCGNGRDENCDGMTDEGCCGAVIFTAAPCARGLGACQQMSTTVCSAGRIICGAMPSAIAPRPEVCTNGIDDDCDGMTDEPPCDVPTPP